MEIARVLVMLTKRGYKKDVKVIPARETEKMYLLDSSCDNSIRLSRERLRKDEVVGKPVRLFSYPQNNKFGYYAWTHMQNIKATTADLIEKTQQDAKDAYEEITQIPWAEINVNTDYPDADV